MHGEKKHSSSAATNNKEEGGRSNNSSGKASGKLSFTSRLAAVVNDRSNTVHLVLSVMVITSTEN